MSKKLSDVLELPIKIDVSSLTPEERAELQSELFSVGITWSTLVVSDATRVQYLNAHSYYIYEDSKLTYSLSHLNFLRSTHKEISIQQLKEKIKMCKQFTKADLKDGMVVLLRGSNDRHLVINDRFVAYNGWIDFSSYDNNLFENEYQMNDFDVMEVFEVISLSDLAITKWELKSIWKREALSERDKQIISIREKMLELERQLETLQDTKQQ